MTGIIFDIKKFAIHDGPGIRTTVFFKGCPLRCSWCQTPEATHPGPELVWTEDKCIHCGACFEACPNDARERLADGSHIIHRDWCTLCSACVEVCHAEALVMEGRHVTVEQVMAEVRKDIPYYKDSGGGVTLSGGEPTFQNDFALALLKQCKSEGLHTAVDTAGHTPWRFFKKILPYTDLVLFDIKQMDSAAHKQHTGVSNKKILANLPRIGDFGVAIEIRMPIVPGINDSRETIEHAASFLAEVKNITRVVLLPYHKRGVAKYGRLDREAYKLDHVEPPDPDHMREIADWIRPYGLDVHVG